MATAKADQSAVQYLPPTINARFKDRLPDIMNEIWRSMLVIEPEIDKMLVPINEFLDHLEYEIRKAELEVAQLEWKTRVSPAELNAAKDWLSRLKKLEDDFQVDRIVATVPFTRDLLKCVQQSFGKLAGVADATP
jgi:DNA repair ATPase RecN